MIVSDQIETLEAGINHFDPQVRSESLSELIVRAQAGAVPLTPEVNVANLHCHTFYSFNAYGYSPTGLAWLAKKNGYRLIGMVDFDVLDGVDEFLGACERLGVRGTAGLETRIFLPEFATRVINSPGEPGISYHMGVGFSSSQVLPEVKPILEDLRRRAAQRNRLVVERINNFLQPVHIDYEQHVIPLTPAGNPTERHIVQAYLNAAQQTLLDPSVFWSKMLDLPADQVTAVMQDPGPFQNLVRTKLIKRGGAGYIEPTPQTFPSLQEVNRLTLACGAIPCVAWLDGASQGEQDIEELLDLMIQQGAAVLNIIPDRNWNIHDEQLRQQKLAKLFEIVRLAGELSLPVIVGTEMNSFGQRLVDDFDAPELRPVRQVFLDGAHFLYGHTLLQHALGFGYVSDWAKSQFTRKPERINFYSQMGTLAPPGAASLERLRSAGQSADPEQLRRLFLSIPTH
jgi:hypothetical protein